MLLIKLRKNILLQEQFYSNFYFQFFYLFFFFWNFKKQNNWGKKKKNERYLSLGDINFAYICYDNFTTLLFQKEPELKISTTQIPSGIFNFPSNQIKINK